MVIEGQIRVVLVLRNVDAHGTLAILFDQLLFQPSVSQPHTCTHPSYI